jgi:hypothetical protein
MIFRAKYVHNFKVNVFNQNLEGSKILELQTLKSFVVTTTAGILLYDSETFQQIGKLDMTLLNSDEREPNEVLTIQKC